MHPERNLKIGLSLAGIALAVAFYSFLVIKTRGHRVDTTPLTRWQSIWRGL